MMRLRHRLRIALLASLHVPACTSMQMRGSSPAPALFDQYEIETGIAPRQTILSGALLGGELAQLAAVWIDAKEHRQLRVYANAVAPRPSYPDGTRFVMSVADDYRDGIWVPMLEASLGEDVAFVDVARIDGRDRVLAYAPGQLRWFDPESGAIHPLVAVECTFRPPPRGDVPHVDVTHDVNGDGRDDLTVPVKDGVAVFVQLPDGTFDAPVRVGTPASSPRIYGADGYRYDPWTEGGRVHQADFDRDGRDDLIFWNVDHFDAHLQRVDGRFAATPTSFSTNVHFDSDEIASLAAPHEARQRRRDHGLGGALSGRVLHSITDTNGDGVADLVIFALSGKSLLHLHFSTEVHFGTPGENATVFAPEASAAIRSSGIPFDMRPFERTDDQLVDIMYMSLDPNIFTIPGMLIKGMLFYTVSFELDVHPMLDDGTYPHRPAFSHTLEAYAPGVSGEKSALFPPVMIGDVNGDGRADLVSGGGRQHMDVFLGAPDGSPFARRSIETAVRVPTDEEFTWMADLNCDGKQDIVLHEASDTEPHRVTLLIAR